MQKSAQDEALVVDDFHDYTTNKLYRDMFYPEKCLAHGKKFTRKKEDESSASKSDTKA